MDHDKEINDHSAQLLALTAVLAFVFGKIAQADPKLLSAISLGLDDAANFVENFAIKTGKTASPEHTVKAIRVVEEIRAATLGNQSKPRHGV